MARVEEVTGRLRRGDKSGKGGKAASQRWQKWQEWQGGYAAVAKVATGTLRGSGKRGNEEVKEVGEVEKGRVLSVEF